MVSFENTEIAFHYRSDNELKKAYWLFKIMSFDKLVKLGKFIINFAILLRIPIKWILKPTIFNHFCGGEKLEEAAITIELLNIYKIKSVLDYAIEGEETEENFSFALNETLKTIQYASKHPDIPFAVFKPSAFGKRNILEKASSGNILNSDETNDLNLFMERITILCKFAYKKGIPLMIDAEHSFYQKIIDDICEEMMEKYNKERACIYNTIQMYRTDRLEFLNTLYNKAIAKNYYLGIKFVRGAYMEKERERANLLGKPSPIHPDKISTDCDFNEALKFSVQHIDRISIFNGTHNEESCRLLTDLISIAGLEKDDNRIWFSQLYGMSDNISFNLAHEGYNVTKYVPFGPLKIVLPYLFRRAEENTSVKGQTSRELNLISKELIRRKK